MKYLSLFLLLSLSSCCDWNNKVDEHNLKTATVYTENIKNKTERIETIAIQGSKETKEPQSKIKFEKIKIDAGDIKNSTNKLDVDINNAKKYQQKLKEIIKVNEEKIKNLKNEIENKVNTTWIWIGLMSIGAIIIAVGVALLWFGGVKTGLPVIATGGTLVAISHFIITYAWIVAVVGGVVFLGALGWMIYKYIKTEKEKRIKEQALKETVQSVEVLKAKLNDDDLKEVKDEIKMLQSPETQKHIKVLKNK